MAESYCVELCEPIESVHALGWFVRAKRTELGIPYYLTKHGTVEPDAMPSVYADFYFETELAALETMKQYFEDWNEPFHFSYDDVVQLSESQKMKFI